MSLTITVPPQEFYDRDKCTFITFQGATLTLEHSLLSLSKWESKWEKPFLSSDKTPEEMMDYVKCMTLTKHVDPLAYVCLTEDNVSEITNYMEKKHHANSFSDDDVDKKQKEFITAETIYYQMVAQNIYKDCERWHLNKLMALIRMCAIKNAPPKKMSKSDLYKKHRAINAANKKRFQGKKLR